MSHKGGPDNVDLHGLDQENGKKDFWSKIKSYKKQAKLQDDDLGNQQNEEIVKQDFWKKMKRFAGKVPFTKDAVSMYYCAVDSKTPLKAKGIAFAALAYFILPTDAIPDAILGAGLTDDAAIIIAALKAISSNVTDQHQEKAEAFFDADESKGEGHTDKDE
ncbi:uncharacterized membrane protein YkvA (DUF1232 family) [Scopulibacillus darangshiensis]|uniref:Uncharacterized membrane protein YkvA (DUF1232 family) n=1 Tax=Scopulibacillus darangshiensis TaxID=442528 RepID=A0A4R2NZP0_9BACL|nr:YkvA family protein [Scopulibacillus darangshiensis]TCP27803.1 uncharacterized membrane protein YkvA (DUF1232 family) [Scopulibacillus darangshiensis]